MKGCIDLEDGRRGKEPSARSPNAVPRARMHDVVPSPVSFRVFSCFDAVVIADSMVRVTVDPWKALARNVNEDGGSIMQRNEGANPLSTSTPW